MVGSVAHIHPIRKKNAAYIPGIVIAFVWRLYTWRIIPVSKWLVTPIYKPFRPFIRGPITPFRGLTNHGY